MGERMRKQTDADSHVAAKFSSILRIPSYIKQPWCVYLTANISTIRDKIRDGQTPWIVCIR